MSYFRHPFSLDGRMKKLITALTILFGIFYLFSGVIKIVDIDVFLYLIKSYNIKLFIYLAPVIPVLEIIIGILLILRVWTKNVMLFSILLLVFFTIIYTYGYFTLNIDECGCFGGIEFLKMSPIVFYLRNGILVLLSIYIFNSIEKKPFYLPLLKFALIIVVVIITSIAVGVRSNLNDYLTEYRFSIENIDAYHNKAFIGNNINETVLSKYVDTSKDSTYLLFVFSYKCPHCIVSSFLLNKYVENNTVDKVIGLTKGTRKEHKLYSKNVKPTFEYFMLKQIEIREITNIFPVSFYVANDTVQFRIKGALPEYQKFEAKYLKQ